MYKSFTSSESLPALFQPRVPAYTPSDISWHTPTLTREVVHELGSDFEDSQIDDVIKVGPSPFPTLVHFKSSVRTAGARALRSAPYLASVRRREANRIAKLISSLPTHAANADEFVAWVHEPLARIRTLLDTLTTAEQFRDAEFEGNSCEILRQLRDTFLNGGWQSYINAEARAAALSALRRLGAADEITRDDVYESLDKLLDAALNPSIGFAGDDAEEEETIFG